MMHICYSCAGPCSCLPGDIQDHDCVGCADCLDEKTAYDDDLEVELEDEDEDEFL